jgi:hypothetical protein
MLIDNEVHLQLTLPLVNPVPVSMIQVVLLEEMVDPALPQLPHRWENPFRERKVCCKQVLLPDVLGV